MIHAPSHKIKTDPFHKIRVLLVIGLLFCHLSAPAARAQDNDDAIAALVEVLGASDDAGFHLDILKGINDALKGRRRVDMPKAWPEVYAKLKTSAEPQVRELSQSLAIVFGDPSAFDALKKTLVDAQADAAIRRRSLESLLNAKAADLAPLLHQLMNDKALRADAIKALAAYDHAKTPDVLLGEYKGFSLAEKQAALGTLAARSGYATRLLSAVQANIVPRGDVPADIIRQLRVLEDDKIQAAITDLWGKVNDTPADKQKQIVALQALLSKPSTYEPDVARGRAIFAQSCQQCHMLFGVGGKVGPDITGSNRNNLDYLLQNVVDPNALIGKDYQATEVRTEEDQILVGILEREDDSALTLKTTAGSVIIPKAEISTRKLTEGSMMPQGLIDHLKEAELRDFVAYMASPGQTPLLATANNAIGLFNGQDLSNWSGDGKIWSVEKGEIVGKHRGSTVLANLMSQMVVADYRLKLKVKQVSDEAYSSVLLRAILDKDGEPGGLTANLSPSAHLVVIGDREVSDKSAVKLLKKGEWNSFEVHAVGTKVQTWINGTLLADVEDMKLPRRGHLGLSFFTGGAPAETRFKDIELEVIEKP